MEMIKPENAMLVLDKFASLLDEDIEKRALETVSHSTKEVFNSEAFLEATDRAIASVLSSNELSICEVDVFQAVSLIFFFLNLVSNIEKGKNSETNLKTCSSTTEQRSSVSAEECIQLR
jgi:hypothetical protein